MSSRSFNCGPPSAEDSWRIVDGEHDSFDTSILPSFPSDEDPLLAGGYPSSGQPSSALPSQLSFGDQASQDSIRDFARHHDDDNVILRAPFRPTIPLPASRFKTTASSASPRRDGMRHRPRNPENAPRELGVSEDAKVPPLPRQFASARFTIRLLLACIMSLGVAYAIGGFIVMFYNFTTYPLALSMLPLPGQLQHHHPPCLDLSYIGEARHFLVEAHRRERILDSLEIYSQLSQPTLTQLRPLVEADNSLTHKSLVLDTFDSYFQGTANLTLATQALRDSIRATIAVTLWQADETASQLQPAYQARDTSPSWSRGVVSWLFSPFTVPREPLREYQLNQRHLQHLSSLSWLVSDMLARLQRLAKLIRTTKGQVDTIIRLAPPPDDDERSSPLAQLGWNQWTLLAVKRAQPVLVYNGLQDLSGLADALSTYNVDLGRLASHILAFKKGLTFEVRRARLHVKGGARRDHCSPRETQVEFLEQFAAEMRAYVANLEYE